MISESLNIFEYEQILMGQRLNFGCSFKGTYKENCIAVGNVWRYAVTHLLKWTPQEAAKYMTAEIVEMLCLDKTFKAIGFKPKCSYIGDYRFVLQYAFPDEIKFDMRKQAINEYQRVAGIGRWAGEKEEHRFPKKFFLDNNGIERANIVFNYVISLYLGDMSVPELYQFFSKKREALAWLKDKRLDAPLKLIYNDPIEYLHCSLPYSKRDNLLYYNIRVNDLYEKTKRQTSKDENKKKKKIVLRKRTVSA